MKRAVYNLLAILMIIPSMTGCARLALIAAPSLIPDMTQAFFEECDLELAERSLPAQLKLLEGLLKNTPGQRQLLTALCTGYTGYAMLFVEEEDPERASALYLRARAYGLEAIGIESVNPRTISGRLDDIGNEGIAPLFWATMAWNAWINLNLHKPAALGQLNSAQECLERIMEIDPSYFYGSPYIMIGSMLAARPGVLGGDAARAKEYFQKAMEVSSGEFLLAQYHFAKYYAVRVQDKELFLELIKEVETAPLDRLKEACLINRATKKRMKGLEEKTEELFY